MTEAQKNRDREKRGIRSVKCMNKDIKRAKNIIQDLEHYGPAGLIHIAILSNIIGKPIKIWNTNGSLNKIIGKEKIGHAIDIEYHASDREPLGHWTLKHSKDPDNTRLDLNSCLFSVVSSQIGQDSLELRKQTLLSLKNNLEQLADQVNEIIRLERKNGKIMLMIGGACYNGTSISSARLILDKSQNAPCHGFSTKGHPRGHASYPSATNPYDSVENYSLFTKKEKSGFLSRKDQDMVAHLALKSKAAQEAMRKLNGDKINISVMIDISAQTLIKTRNFRNSIELPKGAKYIKGKKNGEQDILSVILVLRHHMNESKNPCADVFVHTFYPIL